MSFHPQGTDSGPEPPLHCSFWAISFVPIPQCFSKSTSFRDHQRLLFFLNFQLEDNCFTMLHWFLPYINVNQGCVCVCVCVCVCPLPLEAPSLLPPRLTPLGRQRAPGHTANSYWLSVLHTVKCMFPRYSLNSSHSLSFPHPTVSTNLFSKPVSQCSPANTSIRVIFQMHIYASTETLQAL